MCGTVLVMVFLTGCCSFGHSVKSLLISTDMCQLLDLGIGMTCLKVISFWTKTLKPYFILTPNKPIKLDMSLCFMMIKMR